MLVLDSVTKSLELFLGGAVTTTQLTWITGYSERIRALPEHRLHAATDGISNDTTAVMLVGAPSIAVTRQLDYLSLMNTDSVAATPHLRINHNGTMRPVWTGTLQPNETLFYDDAHGFYALDSQGRLKTTGAGTSSAGLVSVLHPNQTLTNSAAADADFASLLTIPANGLTPGTAYRVTMHYASVTGVAAASIIPYLKLGTTKVVAAATAQVPGNSLTRNWQLVYLLFATAAPGAAVFVDASQVAQEDVPTSVNSIAPQALATNGALTIVPGVTWGSNTNLDSLTLRNALIELMIMG